MAQRFEPQPGLGRALKQLRKARQMTQQQVATAAGLEPAWLSHIESGRNNPAWGTVRRLAAALDVTMAELAQLADDLDD